MTFAPGWRGVDEGIFGGLVLARFVDLTREVPGYVPQSLSLHFVSAVRPGDADPHVEVLHRGRATASLRLTLRQDGRVRAHAIASLTRDPGPVRWAQGAGTGVPRGPDGIPPTADRGHPPGPYDAHLDIRPVASATLTGGARAWIRLAADPGDHRLTGPHALAAMYLDALPPGLFAGPEPPRFVPTVDFTVHFAPAAAGLQASEWAYLENITAWTAQDTCVDESALYDRAGRPLARLRQGRAIRWHH